MADDPKRYAFLSWVNA